MVKVGDQNKVTQPSRALLSDGVSSRSLTKKSKLMKKIEMSPVTFSMIGLLAMLSLSAVILMVIHWNFPSTRGSTLVNIGMLLLCIGAWLTCWQEDEKNEKKSGDKANESQDPAKAVNSIPDGYVGIIEVMEMPIKWLMLSEGKIWRIPYVLGVKSQDVRKIEFQVPTTAAEGGFQAISKDNIQLSVRVSVPISIIRDEMFRVIFEIGVGTALNAIRNVIVDQVRSHVAGTNADIITKANSKERAAMVEAIKVAVQATAELNGYKVMEDELKIPKCDYADDIVKKALEEGVVRGGKNKGVNMLQIDIDKRVQELTKAAIASGIPPAEAYNQARKDAQIEYGLTTRQEIITGPGTNVLIGADPNK